MLSLPVKAGVILCLLMSVAVPLTVGCTNSADQVTPLSIQTRLEAIPLSAVKMAPETDKHLPELYSDEYEKPIPLTVAVNTAGAEDSAFVTPDGNTLYFFFTPDVKVPPEKQIQDGVTGIYVSSKQGDQWAPAHRVVLQDKNNLALDGCVFIQGNTMWFGSARKGNYRDVDVWTAQFENGRWTKWENAGKLLNVDYKVGELHITADGAEMYFHSPREGGKGGYDIWVTRMTNGGWQEPENVEVVNTKDVEGWPFITQDGCELWFTRTYLGSPAIFRSKKINEMWGDPELIIAQFAGEPSLDVTGNLYFTHHYYIDGEMVEADIYVAYRK